MSSGYIIPVDPSELAGRVSHDPRTEFVDLEEAANITDEDVADLFGANDYESKIAPLLDRIPAKEADLIYLYFIQRKRQLDIATIFGITQAAVSYRLERGIHRIKFLLSIPHVTDEELRADLPEVFPFELPCPLCCSARAKVLWDAEPVDEAAPESIPPESTTKSGKRKKSKAPPALPAPGEVCRVCQDRRTLLIDVAILIGMWATTCQSAVAEDLNLTQGRVRHRFFKAVEILEQAAERDPRFQPYAQVFSTIRNGKNFNVLREVKLPQWSDRGKDECF